MKKRKLLFLLLMALLLPTAIKAQVALPYTCGFEEGDDLSGWSGYNWGSNSQYNTGIFSDIGVDESNAFGFTYTTETPQYLIAPELTGTENGVVVEFYYAAISSYYPESFEVGYSMESEDVTDDTWTWSDEITTDDTDYQLFSETFPAGVKYVAVKCTSYDQFFLFVDDFIFIAPGACKPVKGVTVSDITFSSANISWTLIDTEQDEWQVSVFGEGETPEDGDIYVTNTNSYLLEGLSPETTYQVAVRAFCGDNDYSAWSKVASFTTTGRYVGPSNVTASNITDSSADISWTAAADETSWNLRYQKVTKVDPANGIPDDWTLLDDDGDGYGWSVTNYDDGSSYFTSASYDNPTHTALTPDNWLISPKVSLGGAFTFEAYGQDPNYAAEHFAVFVSTDSNDDPSDFVQVSEEFIATATPTLYSIDLSAYAGQEGYIAIRHYNVTDMFVLNVGNIYYGESGDWTTVENVTSPYTLSGLEYPESYGVQVQSVYGESGISNWVGTAFTTVMDLTLLDNDYDQPEGEKNTDILAKYLNKEANVTLSGRTLYKDGSWNTLVLPFSLTAEQLEASPLAGATVKYVASSSTVDGTHVTLNLSSYTDGIVAGYPFYLKWNSGEDITDPTFENVVIEEAEEPFGALNNDNSIYTIGFYSSYLLKPESELGDDEPLIYYLSADNQLRFTGQQRVINAFRHGLIFRNLDAGALTFTLNFEDGETTGIVEVDGKQTATPAEGIYNLQGVKLNGQPKQKGVYINNGKKMVIK